MPTAHRVPSTLKTKPTKTRGSTSLYTPRNVSSRIRHTLAKRRALFHGHEPIATRCSRFIKHLFACPEDHPSEPRVNLTHFIASLLHRANAHPLVLYTALIFLQRMKSRFPDAQASSGHRLILSALILASKFLCDNSYTNKSWALIARGMFTVADINQMEREMFNYLSWDLNVNSRAISDFENFVSTHFSKDRASYPTYVTPTIVSQPCNSRAATSCMTPPIIAHVPGTPTTAPIPQEGIQHPSSLDTTGVANPRRQAHGHGSQSITPPPPYLSLKGHSPVDSAIPGFSHVEAAIPEHLLRGQMFAFSLPSIF